MPKLHNYDWKSLIAQQQISGMNMKKFCEEKNLPYQTFKNHKYAMQSSDTKSISFLPVKQEIAKKVEFTINGNLISFDATLDEEHVSRIIKALTV